MPQTREHLDICALLKIPTGIIAITKCDIVDQDILEIVRGELRAHVKNGFLQNAPIIPVSAACGLGLDELKKALLKTAQSVPSRNSQAVFRLPIDRCFTRHGFGTIVTGTLMSGMISRDEEVEIYPTGRKSRIRNVQVHNRPVDYAIAGQRTALNLQNVEVSEIQRGMQLSVPNRFHPSLMVDTKLHLLETSPIPLTKRTRVPPVQWVLKRFYQDKPALLGLLWKAQFWQFWAITSFSVEFPPWLPSVEELSWMLDRSVQGRT